MNKNSQRLWKWIPALGLALLLHIVVVILFLKDSDYTHPTNISQNTAHNHNFDTEPANDSHSTIKTNLKQDLNQSPTDQKITITAIANNQPTNLSETSENDLATLETKENQATNVIEISENNSETESDLRTLTSTSEKNETTVVVIDDGNLTTQTDNLTNNQTEKTQAIKDNGLLDIDLPANQINRNNEIMADTPQNKAVDNLQAQTDAVKADIENINTQISQHIESIKQQNQQKIDDSLSINNTSDNIKSDSEMSNSNETSINTIYIE